MFFDYSLINLFRILVDKVNNSMFKEESNAITSIVNGAATETKA